MLHIDPGLPQIIIVHYDGTFLLRLRTQSEPKLLSFADLRVILKKHEDRYPVLADPYQFVAQTYPVEPLDEVIEIASPDGKVYIQSDRRTPVPGPKSVAVPSPGSAGRMQLELTGQPEATQDSGLNSIWHLEQKKKKQTSNKKEAPVAQ